MSARVRLHQFLAVDGLADERHHRAHVLFEDAADLLVLVRVDHRADAFVAEDLGEQRFVVHAVEQDARAARRGGRRAPRARAWRAARHRSRARFFFADSSASAIESCRINSPPRSQPSLAER